MFISCLSLTFTLSSVNRNLNEVPTAGFKCSELMDLSDVNARRSWVIKCEVTFSWPRKDAVPCHVLNVSTFLSTKLLERGLAVKDKHVRTEAVIG